MPGISTMPALRLAIMSRCGVMTLRMVMICRFIAEQGAELLLGRVLEDRALKVVDRVVEVGQDREERVDQGVHDQVEDDDLRCGKLAVSSRGWRRAGSRYRAPGNSRPGGG